MSHKRSSKVRYFLGARIADMKYYSVPLLMKQPERIIMHVGTNDAFLTPENMFKELKELSSCYRTVPSAIWEKFSEFLIFATYCPSLHEPLGE